MKQLIRGVSIAGIGVLLTLGSTVPTLFASVQQSSSLVTSTSSSSTTQMVSSGSSPVDGNSQAQAKLTSADAIKIAAKLFPATFKKLGTPQANLMSNQDGRMLYQLNWQPMGPMNNVGPRLQNNYAFIGIDANTGQVVQFQDGHSGWNNLQTSTVSTDKALLTVHNWLHTLAPSQASELVKAQNSGQVNNGFTYVFVRKVNGVIAPFDSVTIHLDDSGNLTNYQFSWHKATFPSVPSQTLSASQVSASYGKDLSLELDYQRQYLRNGPGKLELAYVPQSMSRPSILPQLMPALDAVTGNQVGLDGKPLSIAASAKLQLLNPSGPTQWPSQSQTPLTQKQIEDQVTKQLGLSGSDWSLSSSQDATGNDSIVSGHQIFQLNYMNQKTGNDVSVSVDAADGVVLNYNQNPQVSRTSDISLKNAEMSAKADDFVKQLFPNLTGAIARVPQSEPNFGVSPQVMFRYDFVVHGIPVNGLYVSVDKATGSVVSYNLEQDPSAKFPSDTGAISMQQAKKVFLSANPPVLQYMLPEVQDTKPGIGYRVHYGTTAQLVYTANPGANQSFVLDALTGKFISFPGFGGNSKTGHIPANASPAQKAMSLLEQNGIVTSDEAKAKLSNSMTREEFVVWLERAYNMNISGSPSPQFSDVSKADPYAPELSTALMQGWLPNVGDLHPTQPLTRRVAADWIVDWMGWSGVASHTSFFKVPYSDASAVPSSDAGAATIVSDTGIIPLQDGKFNPSDQMTIGDAAMAIQHAAETYSSSRH